MVVNANTINLSWTDNSTRIPPEDGFKLYYSTDGTNWVWFATASACTWWGAAPATTYYFRVTAYNSIGNSAPSNHRQRHDAGGLTAVPVGPNSPAGAHILPTRRPG
jgi:hypothetical protein